MEKESQMTDIRLEALTSAHQVDQLREALNKLRSENASLKHDNERLQVARAAYFAIYDRFEHSPLV